MRFSYTLIVIFTLAQSAFSKPTDFQAPEQGVLDLRNTSFTGKTVFKLNGEWEFYWEKLLSPEDFSEAAHTPDAIGTVPSYWSDYSSPDKEFSNMGYGTYRLLILFPEDLKQELCFEIPVFDCAFDIFFNDKKVGGNGKVGTSKATTVPWYEPFDVCYTPASDTLQIVINVANFHHRRGGFWKSIVMGSAGEMHNKMYRNKMYAGTSIGILLFFSLFFMVFRFFSKKETIMLFFALTALGILMRTVNTGIFFSNHFVYTPWAWQIRMEYTGTFIAHIFGMLYLNMMYPSSFIRKITHVNTVLFSFCLILVFTLPVHLFAYTMFLFQPTILLFLIYYLVRSFIGIIRLNWMDLLFFLGLGFFLFAMVNDIMISHSHNAVTNDYLTNIAFQLFILVQAVLLIKRWVDNYNERIILNKEIAFINKNLEKIVDDRTEELQGKNAELESTLKFKNQILSIIAHDLKNPISSLAQFSDLLLSDIKVEKNDEILRSLQQSSYAAVNLIDNLLYWGRNQSNQITYLPEPTNLKVVVKDVLSLFKHMIHQKELQVVNEIPDKIIALSDKVLSNIVIRNILSNAIKFTPRKGSINIRSELLDGQIKLFFEDSGVGIPKERLERFKKEGHLDTTAGTEAEKGTGLGLQLISDLVKINKGELHIESESGKGTSIWFTLPENSG